MVVSLTLYVGIHMNKRIWQNCLCNLSTRFQQLQFFQKIFFYFYVIVIMLYILLISFQSVYFRLMFLSHLLIACTNYSIKKRFCDNLYLVFAHLYSHSFNLLQDHVR